MTPMDRRKFIKVTAITGATAALAQCGNPENQIIRFIPEDDLVPGVATWKPSYCPLCRRGVMSSQVPLSTRTSSRATDRLSVAVPMIEMRG